MKKSIAALLALALVTGTVVAKEHFHSIDKELEKIEQLQLRLNKTAPKPITQEKMNKAHGMLKITCPGDYCLAENVCGTIIIKADSVCLDLCCHTLNAHGRPHAIMANGYQGLKVFDGRIINSTDAAIMIDNYSAVELFKLVMSNNALDAIRETNSIDLSVHDVDFIGDESGERALLLDTCNNILVSNCNASGYLSTLGAIVQLDSCNAASVQNVDVTNNTKTAAADVDEFTSGTAFVSVGGSTGVDFVRVKVNNNTFNNTVAVADQSSHWRSAEAILFLESTSCSLHQCETSNNTDIAGNVATVDTEDLMLCLIFCDSCIVTEHQSNTNSCTQPILYFVAVACFDSSNNVFEGCQANSNVASELFVLPGLESIMAPMWIASYFDFTLSNDSVLRNCQANFNRVTSGGAGRTDFNTGAYIEGILVGGTNVIVDHCQANHNTMGDNEPFTGSVGITSLGNNIKIVDSTADNNVGGEQAFGIDFFFSNLGTRGRNPEVSNCSASSNGNNGIVVGFSGDLTETALDVVITDCVCNRNGGQPGPASGIRVEPITPGTINLFIKGCQVYDTSSNDDDATGIIVTNATNVVVEDCNIFNTTADGEGHGILLDTVTNAKILRTQVHGNQDSGVELVGENTNVAILDSIAINNDKGFSVAAGSSLVHGIVQGNRAIGNTSVGFEHAALLPAPFDTGYQKNYAQNNGVNYSISNIIQIVDYSIPTATYLLEPNGATDFPTQVNVSAT